MVGTPAATVTRSSSIRRASGSAWRKRLGMTMSAPTNSEACGSPHALAWNIGTTGITRSALQMPIESVRHWPSACSTLERCAYRTPLGLPVVPLV